MASSSMPIKTFSEKAALAEYAGFPDIDSYDERRANKRCFKPYFEKFCENVICPYLQSPDFDPQEIKKRMPSLNEVDAHLTLKNKRPPRYHQMERDMDKTNWLLIDHYACAVFQIRGANVMFPEGIFFNKEEMLREDRHYIIWALLRHEIDELLRPENGEGREKILKAVEEQQNGGEDEARELEAMIREFGTPWWKIFVPISDASDDIFYDRLANLDDWDDEYDDEEDYGDTLSGYGTNNSGTENDTADENEQ